jgi:hypothetical protein
MGCSRIPALNNGSIETGCVNKKISLSATVDNYLQKLLHCVICFFHGMKATGLRHASKTPEPFRGKVWSRAGRTWGFRYKYPLLMQASLSRRDSTFGTNDDFGCNDDIPVGPRVGYTVGSRETTRQRLETSSSSYYTPQLARRFDFLLSSFNIKKQYHKSWRIFSPTFLR